MIQCHFKSCNPDNIFSRGYCFCAKKCKDLSKTIVLSITPSLVLETYSTQPILQIIPHHKDHALLS